MRVHRQMQFRIQPLWRALRPGCRPRTMLVYFDLTGVNHHQLQIRRVNQGGQQFRPDALLTPTAEPTPVIDGWAQPSP